MEQCMQKSLGGLNIDIARILVMSVLQLLQAQSTSEGTSKKGHRNYKLEEQVILYRV